MRKIKTDDQFRAAEEKFMRKWNSGKSLVNAVHTYIAPRKNWNEGITGENLCRLIAENYGKYNSRLLRVTPATISRCVSQINLFLGNICHFVSRPSYVVDNTNERKLQWRYFNINDSLDGGFARDKYESSIYRNLKKNTNLSEYEQGLTERQKIQQVIHQHEKLGESV